MKEKINIYVLSVGSGTNEKACNNIYNSRTQVSDYIFSCDYVSPYSFVSPDVCHQIAQPVIFQTMEINRACEKNSFVVKKIEKHLQRVSIFDRITECVGRKVYQNQIPSQEFIKDFDHSCITQKQSFTDVLQNMCFWKFRKIHSKTNMLKSLCKKVADIQDSNFIRIRLQTGVSLWLLLNF